MRFFKKILDWILKSVEMDSSVPLTHHDLRDLGLICVIEKHKIRFWILSDFLKETHPKQLDYEFEISIS